MPLPLSHAAIMSGAICSFKCVLIYFVMNQILKLYKIQFYQINLMIKLYIENSRK